MALHPACTTAEHPRVDRRTLVRAGGLSLVGAGMSDVMRLTACAGDPGSAPRARSVIFLWANGGPSQHETWDPKPLAPAEIRGDYGCISTSVHGTAICEHLPLLAARAHRYSIVRSMHHTADRQFRNEHAASQYMLNTGTCELPQGENTNSIALPRPGRFEWPSLGSMIAYAAPPSGRAGAPPVVHLPRRNQAPVGIGPGALGARYAPWLVEVAPPCYAKDPAGSCPNCFSHDQPDDPSRAPGKGPGAWWDNSSCRDVEFKMPSMFDPPEGVAIERLTSRADLLARLEHDRRQLDRPRSDGDFDAYRQQALELVLSHGRENPFDLSREPEAVRERYGREEWGNAMLLARRLVEAGARMVQVNMRGWDTHQNAFRDLKARLLPSLDRAVSGLLDDLYDRGLIGETLVVLCGEFGRTPRISPIAATGLNAAGVPFTPGRHHWGDVFPCFLAGGGTVAGQVIGRTDATGGFPDGDAYTPEDLAATIFHLMGIGPEREFKDPQGRPFRIWRGKTIAGVL